MSRPRLSQLVLVVLLLVLSACSSTAAPRGESDDASVPNAETAEAVAANTTREASSTSDETASEAESESADEPATLVRYEEGDADYIFDQEALHTFELSLSEDDLAFLDADPTAEEYVEGSLSFEDETVAKVGIRYKGSIGAFVNCLTGANPLQPSGAKKCTKLSMKVKINWGDNPDQKFYGLKKLQLHSMNFDQSQMRDRLGYYLFREMGVPAPRATHARVMINGEYIGLFALIEQIDGRFTREAFDDGTGNLYKEVWPVDLNGDVIDDDGFRKGLKTNEDEDPSFEILRSFAEEVVEAGADGAPAVVEKRMDLEEIISYVVVDRTIRHDDGPFHFYCFRTPCFNHNYYFYEQPTDRTVHLIAWDLDNAFENIVRDANPITPLADAFGETSGDCKPVPYGAFQVPQISAACDPIIAAWATFDDEYDRLLQKFLDGPFSEDNVNTMLDTWSAQIAEATAEAHETHAGALAVTTWQSAITSLQAALEVARAGQ